MPHAWTDEEKILLKKLWHQEGITIEQIKNELNKLLPEGEEKLTYAKVNARGHALFRRRTPKEEKIVEYDEPIDWKKEEQALDARRVVHGLCRRCRKNPTEGLYCEVCATLEYAPTRDLSVSRQHMP